MGMFDYINTNEFICPHCKNKLEKNEAGFQTKDGFKRWRQKLWQQ